MEHELKLYEVAYIVSPAFSEEEARNFHDSVKNGLAGMGGLIEDGGAVLKKRLYYPIKKMREAYFAHFKFMLDPEKLGSLAEKLGIKEVLRYSLVRTKRVPQRAFRPRIFKTALAPEKVSVLQRPAAPAARPIEPAANIEEIDKKLEELLGK